MATAKSRGGCEFSSRYHRNSEETEHQVDLGPAEAVAEYGFGVSFSLPLKTKHLTGAKFLRIPNKFVEDHGHKIESYVNLMGPTGFACKVHLLYAKGLEIRNGFNLFASYHEVEASERLSFTLVAKSLFSVDVYNKYGMRRSLFPGKKPLEISQPPFSIEPAARNSLKRSDEPHLGGADLGQSPKKHRHSPALHENINARVGTMHQASEPSDLRTQRAAACGSAPRPRGRPPKPRASVDTCEDEVVRRSRGRPPKPRASIDTCEGIRRPWKVRTVDTEDQGKNELEVDQRLRVMQMLQKLEKFRAAANSSLRPHKRTKEGESPSRRDEFAGLQERPVRIQTLRSKSFLKSFLRVKNRQGSYTKPSVTIPVAKRKDDEVVALKSSTFHDSKRSTFRTPSPARVHEDFDQDIGDPATSKLRIREYGVQDVSSPAATSTQNYRCMERVDEHLAVLHEAAGASAEAKGLENWSAAVRPNSPAAILYIKKALSTLTLLYFPLAFTEKWLKDYQYRHVLLTNQQGKKWTVLWNPENRPSHLESGWSDFLKENNLRGGGVCILKLLVNSVPIEFSVSFCRNIDQQMDDSPTSCQQNNANLTPCSMELDTPTKKPADELESKGWKSDEGDGSAGRRNRCRALVHVKHEIDLGKFNYGSDCGPRMSTRRPNPGACRRAAAQFYGTMAGSRSAIQATEKAAVKKRRKSTLPAKHKNPSKGVSREVFNVVDSLDTLENPQIALIIKETHIKCGFSASFPEAFPMPNTSMNVTMLGGSGQRYPAMWLVSEEGRRLTSGWRHFADDHKLVTGDVCVFEIASSDCSILVVHVFYTGSRKLKQVLKPAGLSDLNAHTNQQLEQVPKLGTIGPTAYIFVTQTAVTLPFELAFTKVFAKIMMPQKIFEVMLKDRTNQLWPAIWVGTSEDSQRLCGLEDFSTSHQLKVGDVCQFELLSLAPLTFKVNVYGARRQEDFDHENRPLEVVATKAACNPLYSCTLINKGLVRAFEIANRRRMKKAEEIKGTREGTENIDEPGKEKEEKVEKEEIEGNKVEEEEKEEIQGTGKTIRGEDSCDNETLEGLSDLLSELTSKPKHDAQDNPLIILSP